jgi:hypothetical protein
MAKQGKVKLFLQGYRDGVRAAQEERAKLPVAMEGMTWGRVVLIAWCGMLAWAIAGAAGYIIWKVLYGPL